MARNDLKSVLVWFNDCIASCSISVMIPAEPLSIFVLDCSDGSDLDDSSKMSRSLFGSSPIKPVQILRAVSCTDNRFLSLVV